MQFYKLIFHLILDLDAKTLCEIVIGTWAYFRSKYKIKLKV